MSIMLNRIFVRKSWDIILELMVLECVDSPFCYLLLNCVVKNNLHGVRGDLVLKTSVYSLIMVRCRIMDNNIMIYLDVK